MMKRLPDLHFHRDRLAESSLRAADVMTKERMKVRRLSKAVADSEPNDEVRSEP